MEHLPFSAHGLFFLSGVWINGSWGSFSSMYSLRLWDKLRWVLGNLTSDTSNTYAWIDLDNGHRSIMAWYRIFSICLRRVSLSIRPACQQSPICDGQRKEELLDSCSEDRFVGEWSQMGSRLKLRLLLQPHLPKGCSRWRYIEARVGLSFKEATVLYRLAASTGRGHLAPGHSHPQISSKKVDRSRLVAKCANTHSDSLDHWGPTIGHRFLIIAIRDTNAYHMHCILCNNICCTFRIEPLTIVRHISLHTLYIIQYKFTVLELCPVVLIILDISTGVLQWVALMPNWSLLSNGPNILLKGLELSRKFGEAFKVAREAAALSFCLGCPHVFASGSRSRHKPSHLPTRLSYVPRTEGQLMEILRA